MKTLYRVSIQPHSPVFSLLPCPFQRPLPKPLSSLPPYRSRRAPSCATWRAGRKKSSSAPSSTVATLRAGMLCADRRADDVGTEEPKSTRFAKRHRTSFRSLPCRGRRRAVSAARMKPGRTPETYPSGLRRARLPGASARDGRERYHFDEVCVSAPQTLRFLRLPTYQRAQPDLGAGLREGLFDQRLHNICWSISSTECGEIPSCANPGISAEHTLSTCISST